jgi:hypothetical protein
MKSSSILFATLSLISIPLVATSASATVEHVLWDCTARDYHDDHNIESVQVLEQDLGVSPRFVVSVVFNVDYDNHPVAEVAAKQVGPVGNRRGGATLYHGKDLLLTIHTDSKPVDGEIAATLSLKRGTFNAELLCTQR